MKKVTDNPGPKKQRQKRAKYGKCPSQRRREESRWAGRALAQKATKLATELRNAIKRTEKWEAQVAFFSNSA